MYSASALFTSPRRNNLAVFLFTVFGIVTFCRGFFPVKPFLPGYASSSSHENTPGTLSSAVADLTSSAPFTRLAFIVVDALRSDFAFGPDSKMSFVKSLVESGQGLPFTALAQAPTVTLPRLKALMTGSNPTFVDAILNVAEDSSQPVLENVDSWLRQIVLKDSRGIASVEEPHKKVVFAGDDTWLRLLPREWFAFADGVSSFFVSDTVTIDSNVTRHLDHFLTPSASWDVMILHYLGLDHVGHLGGSHSSLMAPKQVEMDKIVQRIFAHLAERDAQDGSHSLLVLVGDHGMTEAGNHGGSSEPETTAALLLATPSYPVQTTTKTSPPDSVYRLHQVVNQIDLVPTLSVLLGLKIPINSMGKLIPSVLERWLPPNQRFKENALQANLDQISRLIEKIDPPVVFDILPKNSQAETQLSEKELLQALKSAQNWLMGRIGDYSLYPILAGLTLLGLACILSIAPITNFRLSRIETFVLAGFCVYLSTFFATSFIEEEHEFWFFFTSTILLVMARKANWNERVIILPAAFSLRIMRSWSKNGQKDLPSFTVSAHLITAPRVLGALNTISYFTALYTPLFALLSAARPSGQPEQTRRQLRLQTLFTRALIFGTLGAFSLFHLLVIALYKESLPLGIVKLDIGDLARMNYVLGGCSWLVARLGIWIDGENSACYQTLETSAITNLLMSLTRRVNLPLFALIALQQKLISMQVCTRSPVLRSALIIALQRTSFFAFGGSNSLATIDLSNAYNGLTNYSMPLVSFLTFASNFAGPILFALSHPKSSEEPNSLYLMYSTAFSTLSLFALALSATHFRQHLFTWTVFSPALLYAIVWNLLVHWSIVVGFSLL